MIHDIPTHRYLRACIGFIISVIVTTCYKCIVAVKERVVPNERNNERLF